MTEFDGIYEEEFCDKCGDTKLGHFAYLNGECACEQCVGAQVIAIANSKLREEQAQRNTP